MQTKISLQDNFIYPWLPVVLLLVVIAAMIFLAFYKKKPKAAQVKESVPVQKNYLKIREDYLAKIDYLAYQCSNKEISVKDSYYGISSIVREFVYEMTGIEVHNFSLTEIERIQMPKIAELIRECYVPEFDHIEKVEKLDANPLDTINRTREVIARWDTAIR